MKHFEKAGEFWLPDDPENRFSGLFSFNRARGLELKLWGKKWAQTVRDRWGKKRNKAVVLPQVIEIYELHGFLENNQKIKLYNLRSLGFGDWVRIFALDFALHGHRLSYSRQPEFNRLKVKYDQLSKWIDVPTIQINFNSKGEAESIVQHLREEQNITISNHRIRLLAYPTGKNELHRAEFKLTLHIDIWFSHYLNFDETVDFLGHLRRFFSFATGLPLSTSELNLPGDDESGEKQELSVYVGGTNLTYSEPGSDFLNKGKSKRRSKNFPAFAYSYVRDNLAHYLVKWFELEEKLKPALALYLTHTYRPGMYLDAVFLSMAQAVEALHKRLYVSSDISIRNRLSRIFDLLEPYKVAVDDWFPDKKSFIRRTGESRTYYTHYPENPEHPEDIAFSGEHLYELANRLKILMQLVIMFALDFPADVVEDIMRHKPEAGYLKPKKPKDTEKE